MARLACIFGCAGPELTPAELVYFAEVRPWGFILFDRNLREATQVRALVAALREAAGDVPVFVDQEGGRVARLRPPLARDWPPPRDHVRAADAPAQAMRERYETIGRELRDLGIDGNCVPCADVARPDTHPFLANRCLSDDPAAVADFARAAAEGSLDAGVLPVVKHLPGHGAAATDSHDELPVVRAPVEELRTVDFPPFAALADLPLGMTAHVVYSALDPAAPATLSRGVVATIREEIGFDGLLMTDDICMGALSGSPAARARAALDAGCDLVLHCDGALPAMREVAAAAGPLTKASVARSERVMSLRASMREGEVANA